MRDVMESAIIQICNIMAVVVTKSRPWTGQVGPVSSQPAASHKRINFGYISPDVLPRVNFTRAIYTKAVIFYCECVQILKKYSRRFALLRRDSPWIRFSLEKEFNF